VTDKTDDQAGPSPPQRKIIHVDMDAFYASVARHAFFPGKTVLRTHGQNPRVAR
jgi:hypothetical protein